MAILDADVAARAGWTVIDLAAAYLDGGATLLQIRAKTMPSGSLLECVSTVVERAHRAGARVIVNDRADVARLAGADGVHVGQEDLSVAAVRAIVGPEAMIGLSTHTLSQFDAALDQSVSYLAMGPVFETRTKATGYEGLGLEPVGRAARAARARGVPVIAIGGITLESAPSVLAAGAATVAVIADLLADADPSNRVRAYMKLVTV